MPNRMIQPRRMLQQMLHCVAEALAVVENKEDYRSAVDDLEHALDLGQEVLKKHLMPMARGFNRGAPTPDPKFEE